MLFYKWKMVLNCRYRVYSDGTLIEWCEFKLKRHLYLAYYMADLVIFYVIPLFLTCLLYGLIARILFMSPLPSGTLGSSASDAPSQATRAGTATTAVRVRRSTSSTSSRVQVYYYYFFAHWYFIPRGLEISKV